MFGEGMIRVFAVVVVGQEEVAIMKRRRICRIHDGKTMKEVSHEGRVRGVNRVCNGFGRSKQARRGTALRRADGKVR